MKMKTQKQKKIIKSIRIIMDSYNSHLDYVYGKLPRIETHTFHKKTSLEYLEVLKTLTELL